MADSGSCHAREAWAPSKVDCAVVYESRDVTESAGEGAPVSAVRDVMSGTAAESLRGDCWAMAEADDGSSSGSTTRYGDCRRRYRQQRGQ